MKGAVPFTLDLPDAGPDPTSRAAGPVTGDGGTVQRTAGAARVVALPPWLPYAADPGTGT